MELVMALLPSVKKTLYYKKVIGRLKALNNPTKEEVITHLAYQAGSSEPQRIIFNYYISLCEKGELNIETL